MPTTSHKKGKAWYEKKRYSFASVRAHVTDAMKFDPDSGAQDALKGVMNSARARVKDLKKDIEDGETDPDIAVELATWEYVLEATTDAWDTIENGPPEDDDEDDE